MDRLFENFFRESLSAWQWPFSDAGAWMPAVDVAENDREVTVRAELPGIEPKDLNVSVSGNQLIISGEKKQSEERTGKDYYHREIRFGSFRRTVPLPEGVDSENVEAEYANGVLTLRLKKSPAAAPRRIEIKTKS
jgi:HSP20 family protein